MVGRASRAGRPATRGRVALLLATALVLATMVPPVSAGAATATNGMLAWYRGSEGQYTDNLGLMIGNPNGTGFRKILDGGEGPVWSPDGNRIAYTIDGQIHTVRADGSDRRPVVVDGWNKGPTWSPDGTKIAFTRGFTNGFDAYYVSATGGTPTRFLTRCLVASGIAWAPSGDRVVFRGWCDNVDDDGGWNLYVTNADEEGSGGRKLLSWEDGNAATGATWSPDGSTILFEMTHEPSDAASWECANGPQSDLHVVSVMSGQGRKITSTSRCTDPDEHTATWSPDGTKIAYLHDVYHSPPESGIAVMNADGTGAKVVAPLFKESVDTTHGTQTTVWVAQRSPSWQPCVAGVTEVCDATRLGDGDGAVGSCVGVTRADVLGSRPPRYVSASQALSTFVNSDAVCRAAWVPRLNADFVPQGLHATTQDVWVSGYFAETKDDPDAFCGVYRVNGVSGEEVAGGPLPSGTGGCRHAGGLTSLGPGRLLVADTHALYVVDAGRVGTNRNPVVDRIALEGRDFRGSFLVEDPDPTYLWVGTSTKSGRGWLRRFARSRMLDGSSLHRSEADSAREIRVPPRAQGGAFASPDRIVISSSTSTCGYLTTVDRSGRTVRERGFGPGVEEIAHAGGKLWAVFEAGARIYPKKFFPVIALFDGDRVDAPEHCDF